MLKIIHILTKFQVGDYVRISKYKDIFAKSYTPNWSEEVFVIKKKIKIQFHGHMLLIILMVKNLLKKDCKKQTKNNLG